MNVVAYDPYVTAARAQQLGVTLLTLDDLLKTSDFITISSSAAKPKPTASASVRNEWRGRWRC